MNWFPLLKIQIPAVLGVPTEFWDVFNTSSQVAATMCVFYGVIWLIVNAIFIRSQNNARSSFVALLVGGIFATFGNWVWISIVAYLAAYIALYLFGYKVIWANILLALPGDKPKDV